MLALGAAEVSSQIDQVFAQWNKTSSPGCAVAVMRDGKTVFARGYGMADLDHDIAISPGSVFHVASISKQFVAASIVLLEKRGKLKFDDPVRKYIPELPDFGKPLTIAHLLHHTSGLRDQWSLLGYAGWRVSEDVVRDEDVLWLVGRMKELNFAPGEMYMYSNTGFTLLGQIVKRVSGKSLREFTSDEIFVPLGMKSTHFRDAHREIVKGMAYGYESSGDTFFMSNPNFDTVGASSLITTVEDLLLWQRNFEEPKVGGKALGETMLQAFTLNSGTKIDYRMGLIEHAYRGLPVVEHSGADAGYRSALVRFPEQKTSVACLCNGVVDAPKLAYQTAEVFLGDRMSATEPKHPEEPKKDAVVAVAKAEYAGRYYSEEVDSNYAVEFSDGGLVLLRKKSQTHKLSGGPAADEFRAQGLGTIKFERDGSGKVTGFRVSNGRVMNLRFVRM